MQGDQPEIFLSLVDLEEKKVTYMDLFKNRRFTLAAITAGLDSFIYGYMEPILAVRLATFGLTTE